MHTQQGETRKETHKEEGEMGRKMTEDESRGSLDGEVRVGKIGRGSKKGRQVM